MLGAVAVAATAGSGVLAAQQTDTSRARELAQLDSLISATATIASRLPNTGQQLQAALRAQPGNTVGSESAFGANWGDAFAGVGYQERTRFSVRPDGSTSLGFGLGDSQRLLGLEVSATSASSLTHGYGKIGSVSMKVHRLLPGAFGVAVGVENIANWGGTDGGSSTYGVLSHTQQIRNDPSGFLGSVAWNVGLGNSRFLSQQDLSAGKTGGVNAFGSAGIRIVERASLIADWTGQDLDAGLSLVPFRSSPLVFSIGVADLTRRAGDGPRLTLGLGGGFRVADLFGGTSR